MNGTPNYLKVVSDSEHTPQVIDENRITATRAETAEYVSQILRGLQGMADRAGLETLCGVLEIAYREARFQACSD